MKVDKWLLCPISPIQPFCMWARWLVTIGVCQFSRYYAFVTGTTATAWKHNRQWGMQHLVSQVWRKWATIWKSFWHCNTDYKIEKVLGQRGYLKGVRYEGLLIVWGFTKCVNQMQIKPIFGSGSI